MSIYDMINRFVNSLTLYTIHGICIGFWMLLIADVWKWFWGILKAFFADLFPGRGKEKDPGDGEP